MTSRTVPPWPADHPIPVAGVIVRRGDEILLVKPHGEELHWLISGFLEPWESVEVAAVREVHEETGLEVEVERLVGSYSCRPIGKNFAFIVCLARPIGGELMIGNEITDAHWFRLDALPPWPHDSPARQAVGDLTTSGSGPKLVRDRIPELIRERGDEPRTKRLSDKEFAAALTHKLVEEAKEFAAAPSAEELADVLEVVRNLATTVGSSMDEVEAIRQRKRIDRGGFEARLLLESVQRGRGKGR